MISANLPTADDFDRVVAALGKIERRLAAIEAAQPPQMVPLSEYAQSTGHDPRTYLAAHKRGEIAMRRIGRRWMVDLASLRPASEIEIAHLAAEARGQ